MAAASSIYMVKLIGRFLLGQGLINFINIIVGFLLLRILSLEEFAIYTLLLTFLQVCMSNSDMGLAHAVNSFGAPIRDDKNKIGVLVASANSLSYNLYLVTVVLVSIYALYIFTDQKLSVLNAICYLLIIILLTNNYRILNIKKSILNINRNDKGLFYAGLIEAMTKVLFTLLCLIWPYALIAIFGTLVGSYFARYAVEIHCRALCGKEQPPNASEIDKLKRFIIPLVPVILYFSIQGQLSIFVLAFFGYVEFVAEVGALNRLAQLITILMLLNGFIIQPMFSRVTDRGQFISMVAKLAFIFILFSLVCMASVYLVPDFWLALLGEKFNNLYTELPLAVFAALLNLLGGTIYTLVIARRYTRGQWIYVATGLLAQSLFLLIVGIDTTFEAMLLGLLSVSAYALTQTYLLIRVIIIWKQDD